MLSLLDNAASALLPVVVDLGHGQPKLDAYASGVERDDQGTRLRLAPIAAGALAKQDAWVCIRPAAPPESWELRARGIAARGERSAVVDLAHARVVEGGADSGPASVRSDLLVLVIPGGLDDRSAYVFPVIEITADVCEIQATEPLDPGARWDLVEIIGDRRLLRRASAQVLDIEPRFLADGSPCFRCRLALGPEAAASDRSYDLVTQASQVRRLLDFAGMTNAPGYYEAPGWGRGALRFLAVDRDSATLELHPGPRATGLPHGHVRVGVELFAVQYEMEVRVLAIEGGQARTSLPLILRRRQRHRRAHRTGVSAEESLSLVFLHPVTGRCETHPVRDVSFYGVSFRADPLRSVFWRTLPLERAHLDWRGRTIDLGDLVVEGIHDTEGELLCTASITDTRVVDDTVMIELLATLAHPDVRVYDGEDFDAMHAVYLKAGLFGPHMHDNLAPMMEQTREVWRRLHSGASDVVRTLVHGPADEPNAAVTVMRAWEHGWLLQHFVDVSPQAEGATGKLQHAYLDHLVPRPDGRYLVFFVKEDNHIMNAYLTRFFANTGTREAVCRSPVELWSQGTDARGAAPTACANVATDGIAIRSMTETDAPVTQRAAERCLGAFATGALSMCARDLWLPDTRARFAQAGLERTRECHVVWRGSERAYAMIDERSTPGMNLTWMLNATWLIPMQSDVDRAGLCAALERVLGLPSQSATGQRFLNLPAGLDAATLEAFGFRREANLHLYVLNRSGLHRFFHYAASRYGELEARTRRKGARRAKSREAAE